MASWNASRLLVVIRSGRMRVSPLAAAIAPSGKRQRVRSPRTHRSSPPARARTPKTKSSLTRRKTCATSGSGALARLGLACRRGSARARPCVQARAPRRRPRRRTRTPVARARGAGRGRGRGRGRRRRRRRGRGRRRRRGAATTACSPRVERETHPRSLGAPIVPPCSDVSRPSGRCAAVLRGRGRATAKQPGHVVRAAACGVCVRALEREGSRRFTMLRIYTTMLDALRELRRVLVAIEKHDADLGRQLRRAASSVALNLAEGSGSAGGTRTARYRTALGSARETTACLDVAEALGYCGCVDDGLRRKLGEVVAGLVRLTV